MGVNTSKQCKMLQCSGEVKPWQLSCNRES